MQYREYKMRDRSTWSKGPWDSEPDKVQWRDEATHFPCLAVRGPLGAWCGYVGVDKKHPLYKKRYQDVDARVHGGLTFSDFCADKADEAHAICHVPGPGEPDKVWWFGFDCAHGHDCIPGMGSMPYLPVMTEIFSNVHEYRDLNYVKENCRQLAVQLSDGTLLT
jgi:hypothetical protein